MTGKQTAAPAGKPAAAATKKATPVPAAPHQAAGKPAPKQAAQPTGLAATAAPTIFDNAQLLAASDAWAAAVKASNLAPLFFYDTRLTYVSLAASVAARLLDAPGKPAYLKARFVVYDAPDGQSRFTVALCTADGNYTPLTDWYLCDSTWTLPSLINAEISYKLARQWMNAWLDAPEIAPAMFTVPDGTLRGYNFSVNDLAQALSRAQPSDDKFVRMCFGLHDKTQTFGLILRVMTAGGDPGPEVPCYDLATAVPPSR